MPKRSAYIVLVILSVITMVAAWWEYDHSTKVEAEILKELSAEDVAAILKTENGGGGRERSIAATPESRRKFLEGLREYLSLAADARREGLADDATFKVNFEYKQMILLSTLYQGSINEGREQPHFLTKEEIGSVWLDQSNERAFDRDMDAMQSIQAAVAETLGSNITPGRLQGESLEKAKANWAKAKIFSDMAKADPEFMNRPDLALRIKVLETGILSSDLLRKRWKTHIRSLPEEIAAWIAERPEYQQATKKRLAESLLKRALEGDDIAQLISDFSEHRPKVDNGGLWQDVPADQLDAVLAAVLNKLSPGQLYEQIVETEFGYYIVKLESTATNRSGNEQGLNRYSFRQLVIQKRFPQPGVSDPDIPSPLMTAEEIAKMEIEKTKRDRFVSESVERNRISLPDDFTL